MVTPPFSINKYFSPTDSVNLFSKSILLNKLSSIRQSIQERKDKLDAIDRHHPVNFKIANKALRRSNSEPSNRSNRLKQKIQMIREQTENRKGVTLAAINRCEGSFCLAESIQLKLKKSTENKESIAIEQEKIKKKMITVLTELESERKELADLRQKQIETAKSIAIFKNTLDKDFKKLTKISSDIFQIDECERKIGEDYIDLRNQCKILSFEQEKLEKAFNQLIEKNQSSTISEVACDTLKKLKNNLFSAEKMVKKLGIETAKNITNVLSFTANWMSENFDRAKLKTVSVLVFAVVEALKLAFNIVINMTTKIFKEIWGNISPVTRIAMSVLTVYFIKKAIFTRPILCTVLVVSLAAVLKDSFYEVNGISKEV